MHYIIQKLGHKDLGKFKQLCILFTLVFEEKKIIDTDLPSDKYLKSILKKPEFHVFIALAEGKVVGGLTGYELPMYLKEEKELYLYDLAVNLEYRKKGIATALVNELRNFTKKNNIKIIFVEAESEEDGAVGFYKSLKDIEHLKIDHFNLH